MSAILEFADKLRSQVDIADVVGRYVELRRMGTNMKGLCPFHNEKTPSFTVSTAKQIFHCFGCHEGGDIIKFVQKIERLEWMDAVRHLSAEFGIPMPEMQRSSREEAGSRDEKTAALAAVEFALRFFVRELQRKIGEGHEIREYLNNRRMGPEIAKRFQLGLAPDGWTGLMDSAKNAGVSRAALLNSGLITKHAVKDSVYDRFRNRLIFPIHDLHGAPVAFGARVYAGNSSPDEPKYINSPETLAYHKGQALYAMHLAKEEIVKQKMALLMEGYMDVIRAHEHGITNCIASCGTAFTDEQARLLKRFCTDVVFVYDGDAAGQKAMLKGTETLLDQGLNVAIVSLPEGHDPDSFLTENGREAFQELISKAPNFYKHFLAQALRQFNVNSPEGKVQTVELLLPLLRRVKKPIARNDYVRMLADRLQVDIALIQRQLSDNNPRSLDRLRENFSDSNDSREGLVERTLLKLMIECPTARMRIYEKVKLEWLRDSAVKKWFRVCQDLQTSEINWDYLMGCSEIEDEDERGFLRSLAVIDEGCDSSEKTIDHVAARIHRHYLREINRRNAAEIDEFFQGGHPEDRMIDSLRRADENVTPVRPLLNKYFLKNQSSPDGS